MLVAHGLLSVGSGPSTDVELWQDGEAARKALAPAATRSVARVPRRRQRPKPTLPTSIADCPKTNPESDIPGKSL